MSISSLLYYIASQTINNTEKINLDGEHDLPVHDHYFIKDRQHCKSLAREMIHLHYTFVLIRIDTTVVANRVERSYTTDIPYSST